MMDSMAHENFMATVHLHTPGGQRLLTEEYNRTFKGQEAKGEALREMKHFKPAVCVAELGGLQLGFTHRPSEGTSSEKM